MQRVTDIERWLIFNGGIRCGSTWAGLLIKPVTDAPRTFFTEYVLETSHGRVTCRSFKALVQLALGKHPAEQWHPADSQAEGQLSPVPPPNVPTGPGRSDGSA